MFRARANPAGLLVSKPKLLKRSYCSDYHPIPRIRLLGPTLWSLTACSTIYLGCAAYEVYQDAQRAKAKESRWTHGKPFQTFEELEHFRDREATGTTLYRPSRSTSERPELSDPQRLTMGIMGLTAGTHLASSIMPAMMSHLVHTPRLSSNYTLLTSVFGHAGLMHLGLNLYGMFYFIPSAAYSPTFKGSNAHLTAFYLSAGILSSLAQHVTAVWPRRTAGMSSLGASGALFALLGIVGISSPNTQVGMIFLPGSLPIGEAMACIALFDAIGILVRYPYLRLGHGAHLGGLAFGAAYVKYGGDKNIWRPGRRIVFKAMRSLGLL
ncbi:hypothetical protein E0Z10_g9169 [Xylaria hypoxylon]|uniref:Peptidase S54 rhomboid domain-containing protein n=1 Tax=Xylaria hypoxylon TaxID=37992 RepID=A0A4Z0YJR7_9PEZI|nr:hypothetical protein E0Z10_g9169 [Xylaria hypoxylon]